MILIYAINELNFKLNSSKIQYYTFLKTCKKPQKLKNFIHCPESLIFLYLRLTLTSLTLSWQD